MWSSHKTTDLSLCLHCDRSFGQLLLSRFLTWNVPLLQRRCENNFANEIENVAFYTVLMSVIWISFVLLNTTILCNWIIKLALSVWSLKWKSITRFLTRKKLRQKIALNLKRLGGLTHFMSNYCGTGHVDKSKAIFVGISC